MADQPKDIYAPIPARAMADEKLTAEHFRVLMAVAAHDRFNRNGKGCCASHPRLAKLAKCHRKSLSRSLKVLAEWGYIAGLPSPFNKRQRAYRVVYSDADRAIMTNPIGINPATEADPIGNKDFHEPEQNQELPDDKRFSETEKRFSETGNRYSAEAEDAGEQSKEGRDEHANDECEERAAILEYDAGFTRAEAERRAIELDDLIEEGADERHARKELVGSKNNHGNEINPVTRLVTSLAGRGERPR
jgi:DNA-binding MarR family transcriptional regulator